MMYVFVGHKRKEIKGEKKKIVTGMYMCICVCFNFVFLGWVGR